MRNCNSTRTLMNIKTLLIYKYRNLLNINVNKYSRQRLNPRPTIYTPLLAQLTHTSRATSPTMRLRVIYDIFNNKCVSYLDFSKTKSYLNMCFISK